MDGRARGGGAGGGGRGRGEPYSSLPGSTPCPGGATPRTSMTSWQELVPLWRKDVVGGSCVAQPAVAVGPGGVGAPPPAPPVQDAHDLAGGALEVVAVVQRQQVAEAVQAIWGGARVCVCVGGWGGVGGGRDDRQQPAACQRRRKRTLPRLACRPIHLMRL